jgi:hypothetical protein
MIILVDGFFYKFTFKETRKCYSFHSLSTEHKNLFDKEDIHKQCMYYTL